MLGSAKNIKQDILKFRNQWNSNLLAGLNEGIVQEPITIFSSYPELLTDEVIKEVYSLWEASKSKAASEVFGFLLRHRITSELYRLGDLFADPVSRIQYFERRINELTGYKMWDLLHFLYVLAEPKYMLQKAESLLHETDLFYRSYLRNLVGKEDVTISLLEAKLIEQSQRRAKDYPPEFILKTFADLKDGLSINLPVSIISPHKRSAPIVLPLDNATVISFAPFGGREDLRALLHNAGHAWHYAATATEEEYNHLFSISTSESFAFLFQWLTSDKNFISKDEDLAWEQFLILHGWRRQAALYIYHEAIRKTDWIPNEKLYQKIMNDSLCSDIAPARAKSDLDYRFLFLQFLLAFEGTVAWRKKMTSQFGNQWWTSHDAGKYLKEMWRLGNSLNITEIVGLDSNVCVFEV